jgi:hypothetical protein
MLQRMAQNPKSPTPPWPGSGNPRARLVLLDPATDARGNRNGLIDRLRARAFRRICYLSGAEAARDLASILQIDATAVRADDLASFSALDPVAPQSPILVLATPAEARRLLAAWLHPAAPELPADLLPGRVCEIDIDERSVAVRTWNVEVD